MITRTYYLQAIPEYSIILLQACGHNPTGVDPTPEQWSQLSALIKKRKIYPLFDLSYQGLVSGDLNMDAFAIQQFARDGHQMAIAQSFAKNMGKSRKKIIQDVINITFI